MFSTSILNTSFFFSKVKRNLNTSSSSSLASLSSSRGRQNNKHQMSGIQRILNTSSSSSSLASTTAVSGSSSRRTRIMVEIISQETIKPSSPTPHHLKTYKLSFLDHIAPQVYIPFILFYEIGGGQSRDRHLHLKKSLAETLTDFYPLAGKIKRSHEGFLFVDCTDDGVDYFEARVNAQLHETYRDHPDSYLLNQFLPLNPHQLIIRKSESESGLTVPQPILAVQVSIFDCGGMAVGISISHEVADAIAMISFIQAWAAKTLGGSGTKPVAPILGYESLFPTRAAPKYPIAFFRDNIVTKRFVFDSSKISALREKLMMSMNDGSYVTRVEAVSAFIWRRFMKMYQTKVHPGQTGSLQFLCVGHAVNVRKRIDLPQNSFGNLYFSSLIPMFSIDGSEKEYDRFVSRLRDTIHRIDKDFTRRELQSGEDGDYLKFVVKVGQGLHEGELETLNFTSWGRMGYYEVDFGWGKPVWVSPGTMPLKDLVLLLDTKSGNGMEVWANMIPEDIDALEHDEEFLAFVS